MALINKTYFGYGLAQIPNINQEEVLGALTWYINNHENKYLNDVLGVKLKDEFISGLADGLIDVKWTNLLNGVSFICDEDTLQWGGFNNAIKESPISNYVFFHFCRDHTVRFTGLGTVTSEGQNSNVVSPNTKLVDNYNRMVEQNRLLEKFLSENILIYPSYNPMDTLTKSINYYGL